MGSKGDNKTGRYPRNVEAVPDVDDLKGSVSIAALGFDYNYCILLLSRW